jgi:hypothetical protein
LNYPLPPAEDYPENRVGPRRNPWLWIALAVAVVVIVVLAAVVITQAKNDKATTATTAAPQSSITGSAPTSGAQQQPNGVAGQSMTCEGFTASVDPGSQPGWHATVDKRGLAYAAPPDWNVAACGVRMGWAKPCPAGQCVIREIGAVSTIANPSCPKQNLAMAGIGSSKNADIKAALEDEMKTVPLIYSQNGQMPKVDYTAVREFNIGTHPAVQTVANVNGITPNSCTGSSALHSIVVTTVPNVAGSVVFLISLRQGVNATPKPEVIKKMVDALRSPA